MPGLTRHRDHGRGAAGSSMAWLLLCALLALSLPVRADDAPVPLLGPGKPVDWWFVYKFNAKRFPACSAVESEEDAERECPFGGKPGAYGNSQRFAVASSETASLEDGQGCAGSSDPVAATFKQIYEGDFRYLVWNDQFYGSPKVKACSGDSCGGPWGHSKGVLAWNEEGKGVVIQVTTPSWPGFASKKFKRVGGNSLGCIKRPNNIKFAQHFFALSLSPENVVKVIQALRHASVVTDLDRKQIANIGGSPPAIEAALAGLGEKSDDENVLEFDLGHGVKLVSKPSRLYVPPWQMLSATLGGVDLKAATWWASPRIPTTTVTRRIGCWDDALAKPGAVEIAVTGSWKGEEIGLIGSQNHAKIGVSNSGKRGLSIFADLNQQGALKGNCKSSQNGRGGLFYVLDNPDLFNSMTALLDGDVAATR